MACTDRPKVVDHDRINKAIGNLNSIAATIQKNLQSVEVKLDSINNIERKLANLIGVSSTIESISQVTRETKEMTAVIEMHQPNVDKALALMCTAADSMQETVTAMANATGRQTQMETNLAMNSQLQLEDVRQLISTQIDDLVRLHIEPMRLTLGVLQEQTAWPQACEKQVEGDTLGSQFQQAVSVYLSPNATKEPTASLGKFKRARSCSPQLKLELRQELETLQKSLLESLQNSQNEYVKAERDATADEFCKKMEILLHSAQQEMQNRHIFDPENQKGQALNQLDWLPTHPHQNLNFDAEAIRVDDVKHVETPTVNRGLLPSAKSCEDFDTKQLSAELTEENYDEDEENRRAAAMKVPEDGGMKAIFVHDDDLEAPIYHLEDHFKQSGFCQAVARDQMFALVTMVVIVLNAVWIGVESDHNQADNLYDANVVFQVGTQFFCIFFTFEWGVRVFACTKLEYAFRDGWIKFDTFLVTTMVLEQWLLMPILKLAHGGAQVELPTQPLRMLRLAKLTRMARMARAFPELIMMIKGLLRSLRAIASSLMLIALLMYTVSLVAHMLLKDETKLNDDLKTKYEYSFASVPTCLWALLMGGTLMLDNSALLMHDLLFSDKPKPVIAGFAFLLYTLLSALLILQMLIGVLCDVVSRVGAEQREAMAIGLVKQEILAKLQQFDDGDGKISREELRAVLNDPHSRAVFRKLNINLIFLHQLEQAMFIRPDSQVSIKSCLELMVSSRGDCPATVDTLAKGFCFVSRELNELKKYVGKEKTSPLSRLSSSKGRKSVASPGTF